MNSGSEISPSVRRRLPGEILRQRLVESLGSTSSQVVALLVPSGYGKTTLLGQYLDSSPDVVVWLTLYEDHIDYRQLLTSLWSGLQTVREAAPEELLDELLPSTSTISARLLARHLNALDSNLALVLDRTEFLGGESSAFIGKLVDQLREGHRVFLAGYSADGLPLSTWQTQGRLLELRTEDLAFSLEETNIYLRQFSFEGDASQVYSDQEGWPAGIALVAAGARTHLKTGDLVREVMDRLPPPLRGALAEAAVIEEWSEPELQHLGAQLALGWIRSVVGVGLPITPLGNGQYRPHKILLDTLESELRLNPERYTVLHKAAAQRALERSHNFLALRHLILAKAHQEALQLAQQMALLYHQRWEFTLVRRVLEPFDVEALPPLLQFLLGNGMTETKATVQGERLLRSLLDSEEVGAKAYCSLARIAGFRGDHGEQLELVETSIALSRDGEERGVQLATLGWALAELGRFEEAAQAMKEQVAWGKQTNQPLEEAMGLSLLAGVYAVVGRPQEAEQASRHSLQILEELNFSTRALFEKSNLATNLMLRGRLQEARAILDQSIEMVAGEEHALESRLRRSLGDWHMLCGEYQEALRAYELALRACGGQPLEAKAQEIRLQICDAARILGQAGLVQHHMNRAREVAGKSKTLKNRCLFEFQEGLEDFYAGRLERADQHFGQIGESYEVVLLRRALAYRAEIARRLGRLERSQVDKWIKTLDGLGGDQVLQIDAPILHPLYRTCVERSWHAERFEPWLHSLPPDESQTQGLELQLLGKPEVFFDGQRVHIPLSKSMELLACLALRGPASRDELINLLWEGSAQQENGRYFKEALRKLRIALRETTGVQLDPVPYQDGLYGLDPALKIKLDTGLISQALHCAEESALHTALLAYKGPFMKGFFTEWVEETRQDLRDKAVGMVLRLGQMLESENPGLALETYERGLEVDPMSEPLLDALASLLARLEDATGLRRVQRMRERAFE